MKNLIYLTLILLLFSCKKEMVPIECEPQESTEFVTDTVGAYPYFPNYPGSFWEYDDGLVVSIDSNYLREKIFTSTTPNGECFSEENSSVLGVSDGTWFYVGRSIYTSSDKSFFGAWKYHGLVMDTTIGRTIYYVYHQSEGSTSSTREVVKEYIPSLLIQGTTYNNVYRVERLFQAQGSPWSFEYRIQKYYAENVGLILEEKTDDIAISAYRRELVNYFIND